MFVAIIIPYTQFKNLRLAVKISTAHKYVRNCTDVEISMGNLKAIYVRM